jgi:hypothetical protein
MGETRVHIRQIEDAVGVDEYIIGVQDRWNAGAVIDDMARRRW